MTSRFTALAMTAVLVVLGACRGDDYAASTAPSTSGDSSDPDSAEPVGTSDAVPAGAAFCDDYLDLVSGDPTPDRVRAVIGSAPGPARGPLETLAAGFEDQGEEFFGTTEFGGAFDALGAAAADECADASLDVTAVDYAFDGVPAQLDPGIVEVRLANTGREMHELIVLRKNDGVTATFEQIFAHEDQAAASLLTQIGATFAVPGGSGSGLFDLQEPGEYVAVCFIRVGTTVEQPSGADGPTHASQGMLTAFTVG